MSSPAKVGSAEALHRIAIESGILTTSLSYDLAGPNGVITAMDAAASALSRASGLGTVLDKIPHDPNDDRSMPTRRQFTAAPAKLGAGVVAHLVERAGSDDPVARLKALEDLGALGVAVIEALDRFTLPLTDEAGKPLKDKDGKPRMHSAASIARHTLQEVSTHIPTRHRRPYDTLATRRKR